MRSLPVQSYKIGRREVAVTGWIKHDGTLHLTNGTETAASSFWADRYEQPNPCHTVGGLRVDRRCPKYVREAFDRYAEMLGHRTEQAECGCQTISYREDLPDGATSPCLTHTLAMR